MDDLLFEEDLCKFFCFRRPVKKSCGWYSIFIVLGKSSVKGKERRIVLLLKDLWAIFVLKKTCGRYSKFEDLWKVFYL